METIRELIIQHGASIKYVEGICTIRINAIYPHKPVIERVLEDLRLHIYSQEYVDNYVLLK